MYVCPWGITFCLLLYSEQMQIRLPSHSYSSQTRNAETANVASLAEVFSNFLDIPYIKVSNEAIIKRTMSEHIMNSKGNPSHWCMTLIVYFQGQLFRRKAFTYDLCKVILTIYHLYAHKNNVACMVPLTDALVFSYNPLHCFIASEDYWFFISYDIVYHCP